MVMNGGLGQSLEGHLEQLRAGGIMPSPDEQHPLKALRPDVPDLQCMQSEVKRQSHVVVDGQEVTDIQCDRTRRDEQRVQKRARDPWCGHSRRDSR